MIKRWFFTLFCLVAIGLAGCTQNVNLLSNMSDTESNEVLSALLTGGVTATRQVTKDGVSINVNPTQTARALEILRSQGLPRERFDGMGAVFRKEGLVSSPLEERARYLYALSQELSNTLSQMDGVLVARVHVVLPERASLGETAQPSTAAVFIKHRRDYTLDALQPQIRKLVTHSIPGLQESQVSVVLIPAQPANGMSHGANPGSTTDTTTWFSAQDTGLITAVIILLLISLASSGVLGHKLWLERRNKAASKVPSSERP